MQVLEHGVDASAEQALEGLFVQRKLQEIPPSQSAILFRELAVLFEQAAQFRHVELCGALNDILGFFELRCKVHVN